MFGLFKKASTPQESVGYCCELVERSRIEPLMEAGNYAAFMVFLGSDAAALAQHLKHRECMSATVAAIDERIRNGRFYDQSCEISMVRDAREMSGWKPNLAAKRMIFDRNNKPVISWSPQ